MSLFAVIIRGLAVGLHACVGNAISVRCCSPTSVSGGIEGSARHCGRGPRPLTGQPGLFECPLTGLHRGQHRRHVVVGQIREERPGCLQVACVAQRRLWDDLTAGEHLDPGGFGGEHGEPARRRPSRRAAPERISLQP